MLSKPILINKNRLTYFKANFKQKIKMNKLLLLLVFLLIANCKVDAQNTPSQLIKGMVKDENGKAVPFASINVKDQNTFISADSLGLFSINAKINSVLIVGSIGFEPMEINMGSKMEVIVILKRNQQSLKEVSVSAKASNTSTNNSKDLSVQEQQTVSSTLQNYTAASNISTAPTVFSQLQPNGGTGGEPKIVTTFANNTGSGRVYTGSALPVFMPKDDTKGRQYLFAKWLPGVVLNEKGEQIKNDLYLYNYDKMGKVLLFTQDQVNIIELDMNTVSGFSLLSDNEPGTYLKMTILDKTDYYQLLSAAKAKYALYKRTTTKFVKANYVSTGLTSSGNNYDEFLDDTRYFVYSTQAKSFLPVDLKKKPIKAVFENEKSKVDEWFSQNGNAVIDETFLKGLINFLNKE